MTKAAITLASSRVPLVTEARRGPAIAVGQTLIAGALLLLDPVGAALFIAVLILQAGLAAVSVPGSLAATMVALPFFYEPVQAGDSTVAASEMLLWATFAGASLAVAGRSAISWSGGQWGVGSHTPSLSDLWTMRQRIGSLPVLLLAVLAVVGLFLLLGVSDSEARAAGLRAWRWTLLEPLVLVGLLLAFARRQSDRLIIAGGLVVGGVIVSLLGLGELFEGGGVVAGDVRRIDGPFPHPNALALFLLRVVVFAGALVLLSGRLRRFAAVAAFVAGTALLASFARSALVSLVAVGALVSGWVERRIRLAGVALVGLGAIALLVVAGDRMVGSSGLDSLELRVDIWSSGLEMIRDRPVLGYGPDQFLYTYTPRYIEPAAWDERFTAHGHNYLIDAWVRLGIIGAAFALLSVCWIALAASRVVRRPERWSPLGAAAVLALAAAAIQGMVDNGYFAHDLAMSAWLLAWLAFDSPSESATGGP